MPELYLDYRDASLSALRERIDLATCNRAELRARMAAGRERAREHANVLGSELKQLATGRGPFVRQRVPAADRG